MIHCNPSGGSNQSNWQVTPAANNAQNDLDESINRLAEQFDRTPLLQSVVTPVHFAIALAESTMIGWKYGPLMKDDFIPILPNPGQPWYVSVAF